MNFIPHFVFIISTTGILMACHQPNNNTAPQPSKDSIKARQDLMHQWGNSYDIIKNMVKHPESFDAKQLTAQTTLINESKAQMWHYFNGHINDNPPNERANRVNRLVQQNPTDFKQATNQFDEVFERLHQASQHTTSINDIKDEIKQVKASCKSCHKTYKKPSIF